MRGTPLVTISHMSAGYHRTPVIEDVDLTIMRGDFVGLVGPSGAGKTTLLRTILGAVDIFSGTVEIAEEGTDRACSGYVPQINSVDWHFPVTVEEVVMMGLATRSGLLPWSSGSNRDAAGEVDQADLGGAVGRVHCRSHAPLGPGRAGPLSQRIG